MSSSAFLVASFDPSGTAFAAVYQGLDAQRLRVLSLSQSGPQPQEFALDKTHKISAISWTGKPQPDRGQQAKKRRKTGAATEPSDVILLGTNQGITLVFSPSAGDIVAQLKPETSAPVTGFVINEQAPKVGIMQVDGTLTDFDLTRNSALGSLSVPINEPTAISSVAGSALIMGNTAPHSVDDGDVEVTFTGFATPIRQLLPLGPSHFAAIAEEDRQVLVYNLGSPKPVQSLMCPSTSAIHASAAEDLSAVAITTDDGQVHIFASPTEPAEIEKQSKRARGVPQAKPKFSIEALLKKQGTPLLVSRTRFSDNFLQLVWPEQGAVPVFDRVQWRNGDGILTEHIKLEKSPAAPQAREVLVGGLDPASAPLYREGQAKVVSGEHVSDLSDEEGEETLADKLDALEVEMQKDGFAHGSLSGDAVASENSARTREPASRGAKKDLRLQRSEIKLKLSQPGSFATLLNQALTSDDKQLLEMCLEETNEDMVRTSIAKLQPALAATLLENLAALMAHDQSRSALFTQWIRWVVVLHGGYLVTVPNLLRTLASLHSTLSTRAATLPRLIALQGRLELLEAQLAIRSDAAGKADREDEPRAYYDEDEAMIVNGEEADDDEDDVVVEASANGIAHPGETNGSEIRFVDDADMLSDD